MVVPKSQHHSTRGLSLAPASLKTIPRPRKPLPEVHASIAVRHFRQLCDSPGQFIAKSRGFVSSPTWAVVLEIPPPSARSTFGWTRFRRAFAGMGAKSQTCGKATLDLESRPLIRAR